MFTAKLANYIEISINANVTYDVELKFTFRIRPFIKCLN